MTKKIKDLFFALQERLESNLRSGQNALEHSVAKGNASEDNWLKTLEEHLPKRYQVSSAFIIDSKGNQSEQIDLVIYDWQYTPIFYNKNGQKFIPIESVYAVFEVKPSLKREYILYAGKKIASVRKLYRTSAKIPYAAGTYKPRKPFLIIGGILCYENNWQSGFGKPFLHSLQDLNKKERIDLGCVVTNGFFEAEYKKEGINVSYSDKKTTLAAFLFRLLAKLQSLGTVPAIDYDTYSNLLSLHSISTG